MATVTSQERRRRYADLSSRLALLDDRQLANLARTAGRHGWGTSGTASLDEDRVFIKRMPITDLERTHGHSTRNVHRLPAFYNYGVGSAGFGAARELAVHVKTTGWVLADEIETFPLLLHARVLPRRPGKPEPWSSGEEYVRYWNNSKRIGAYIDARNHATQELCLVLEHVPHTLSPWLAEAEHQAEAPRALGQLCDTITFLHDRGVLHLDAHFHNVVTDGRRIHLTDLGLALDRSFELSDADRRFFDAHQHYDYGEAIANLGALLVHVLDHGPPANKAEVRALLDLPETGRRAGPLVRNLERVLDRGLLDLDPAIVELVLRYREVIVWMWTFFGELQANRRKDTPFDDAHLRGLIDDAGGLPKGG
jgi:hypothetical protein